MDDIRRQLDALMGTNRDDPNSSVLKHFSDRDVCKYYLVGLCPHDLFTNTRKELGPCPNLHSEPLKFVYDEERKKKDWGYEKQLGKFLDDLVRECDRTIERQNRKLKEYEAEKLESDPISRQIAALQSQAEKLGEEGNVDEYMKINTEIETLKQKRHQQQVLQIPTGAAGEVIQQHGTQSQQQKLRVCDVCGCYLSKFDSDKRLADHFNGKLHMGYAAIREKLEELKKEGFVEERRESDKNEPLPSSTVVRRNHDNHRNDPYKRETRDRRDRDRDRNDRRDRDRDRDRNDRRDRERDRDRRRERDRDRSRDGKRVRDDYKDKRNGSRDRSRSRDNSKEESRERDSSRHSKRSRRQSGSRSTSRSPSSSRRRRRNHSWSESPSPKR